MKKALKPNHLKKTYNDLEGVTREQIFLLLLSAKNKTMNKQDIGIKLAEKFNNEITNTAIEKHLSKMLDNGLIRKRFKMCDSPYPLFQLAADESGKIDTEKVKRQLRSIDESLDERIKVIDESKIILFTLQEQVRAALDALFYYYLGIITYFSHRNKSE